MYKINTFVIFFFCYLLLVNQNVNAQQNVLNLSISEKINKLIDPLEPDPIFGYLEKNDSQQTRDWVAGQNDKALSWYKSYTEQKILEGEVKDSLNQSKSVANTPIFKKNVYRRFDGVLKKIASHRFTEPDSNWEVVFDTKKLAETVGAGFTFSRRKCLEPEEERCLLFFSKSGTDTELVLEYDLKAQTFINNGFRLPLGKNNQASWLNRDTLLIAANLGPDSVTTAGYPRQVRVLKRGQDLSSAALIYECAQNEVGIIIRTFENSYKKIIVIDKHTTFWTNEYFAVTGDSHSLKLNKLILPDSATELQLVGESLLAFVSKDETINGLELKAGSFVEVDYQNSNFPKVIFWMDQNSQPLNYTDTTQDNLWISYNEDVHGKVATLKKISGDWVFTAHELPLFGVVGFSGGDPFSNQIRIEHATLIENNIYYQADDTDKVSFMEIQRATPFTDPTNLIVEQFKAKSSDGTLVPYFIIRRKDAVGKAVPTVQYAYGGFGAIVHADTINSWFPFYIKSFVARGGAFVLAGIRGGGEYGKKWHEAGIRQNRWNSFRDLFGVAEDLISKGFTTPTQLGLRGDSNGGILMGVALTSRPDLFSAIVMKHGLFDMIRYTSIGDSGPSWIAEFGDPKDPADLEYLKSYSPFQKITAGKKYPPVLVTTATNDDRVHPSHMRKVAAKLEAYGSKTIFYESSVGGHTRQDAEYRLLESTMELQFFMESLGLKN
jgi:prolyl oligopeptidase